MAPDGLVRENSALKPVFGLSLAGAIIALLVLVPKFASGYQLALGSNRNGARLLA